MRESRKEKGKAHSADNSHTAAHNNKQTPKATEYKKPQQYERKY